MKNIGLVLVIVILFSSCKFNKKETEKIVEEPTFTELQTKAKGFFGELPLIAENETNSMSDEKVLLGKTLYFDTILSKNGTQSCNTCHNLDTYGVDNLPTSPGDGTGTMGTRNSPTVLNAALHISQFWDGREPDVEAQAGGPVLNPVEMGMSTEKEVVARLAEVEKYKKLFAAAYPNDENPISYDNMKKAIGAFERKLITPSKFDDYLKGNNAAFTDIEKQGLQLFMDKGCIACHNGNALGGNTYQKFGVYGDYWEHTKSATVDKGRYDITQNDADKYIFKSPSLRNIVKTYPYFHDGSVKDLDEAIKIMGKAQLNMDFSDEEVQAIVAFLHTLTGEVAQEHKM